MLSALPAIAPPDAPKVPGWWPLPPGWWLLGILMFALVVWLLVKLMLRLSSRRRSPKKPDIRAMALAALDELERRESSDDRETAYRLNEILRAALLDPQAGRQWQPFTPRDDVGVDAQEWQAFWHELEMRYRPLEPPHVGKERRRQWLAVARQWLERLPTPDEMQTSP